MAALLLPLYPCPVAVQHCSLCCQELVSLPLDPGLESSLALTSTHAAELMDHFQVRPAEVLCVSAPSPARLAATVRTGS